MFGSVSSARHFITDKIIENLENQYSPEEIWNEYRHYYTQTGKRYEIELDSDKFLGLARRSFKVKEMEPYLKYAEDSITDFIQDYIKSDFFYLADLFNMPVEGLRYTHLKWYLIAPIILDRLVAGGMPVRDIRTTFITPTRPSGISEVAIRNALENVYDLNIDQFTPFVMLTDLRDAVISNNYESGKALSESVFGNARSANNYINRYHISRLMNKLDYYQHFRIAVLGPLVQEYFNKGIPFEIIVKLIPHFLDSQELLKWVNDVFGCTDPYEYFKVNYHDASWFLENFGVYIKPLFKKYTERG